MLISKFPNSLIFYARRATTFAKVNVPKSYFARHSLIPLTQARTPFTNSLIFSFSNFLIGIIGITFHLYHQLRPIEVFFVFLQRYL